MKNLYIYGAKYLDFFKLIDAINRVKPTWKIAGFVGEKKVRKELPLGLPYYQGLEKLQELARQEDNYFLFNKQRNTKASALLKSLNCKTPSFIHPTIDMNYVDIGIGCLLPEGCIVGGFTKIGNFVTVRLSTHISHDVTIEDHVFIGPGASIGGHAVLKKGCFVGQRAVIMGERVVGEGSVVGAGAVVTKDVPPYTTVVGIPAKPMEK